jgi:hypothetical protein
MPSYGRGGPQMAEQQERPGHSTSEVGDIVHYVVAFVLSFLPPGLAVAFPSDVLEDKTLTFITVYFITLPWTLGITVLAALFFAEYLPHPDGRVTVGVIAGILLAAESVGLFLGYTAVPGLGDTARIGHPGYKVLYFIGWTVFGYALIYGLPLFIAGALVGTYCGWVLAEKILHRFR